MSKHWRMKMGKLWVWKTKTGENIPQLSSEQK